MTTLRTRFDLVVDKIETLQSELIRLGAEEAEGRERPDLVRALHFGMPVIVAQWAALKQQLAEGAPDPVVSASLLALERDLTALVLILRGRLRLIFEGEEPN